MCGIIGVLRKEDSANLGTAQLLLEGLKKSDHRGYHGSGMKCYGKPIIKKGVHGFEVLKKEVSGSPESLKHYDSFSGIAHNRWATHGEKDEINAHPHEVGKITLVHNGMIQNYKTLREKALKSGFVPRSGTDSELIAFLIDQAYSETKKIKEALQIVLPQLVGTYGLVIMASDQPSRLFVARHGSPVLVAEDKRGYFVASEQIMFPQSVTSMREMPDGYIAVIEQGYGINLYDLRGAPQTVSEIPREVFIDSYTKEPYRSFMEKEIFEQPIAVVDALRGRLDGEDIRLHGIESLALPLKNIQQIIVLACGTSYHAGLYFRSVCEEFAKVPVHVEYASEMTYVQLHYDKTTTLVVVVSQSGETGDLQSVVSRIKEQGYETIGFINVVGSTLARLCGKGVYLQCGPEKGVASTKAFTVACVLMGLFAIQIGRANGNCLKHHTARYLKGIHALSDMIAKVLASEKEYLTDNHISLLAGSEIKQVLFAACGAHMAVAFEGALKFKEITYKAAEGFPAGEYKHGHLALVDEQVAVFLTMPSSENDDPTLGRMDDTFHITRANKGKIFSVGENSESAEETMENHLPLPHGCSKMHYLITPLIENIWFQLVTLRVAEKLGNNVDKPRNLAKAVTV